MKIVLSKIINIIKECFMRFINNFGFILLAIYLILIGISGLASIAIAPIVLAVLALASGILILIGR